MPASCRTLVRLTAAIGLITAAVLTGPSPAYAAVATVDVSGQLIYYTAGAGQPNHLVIERSADVYIFSEVGGQSISSADRACWYPIAGNPTILSCAAPGLMSLVVSANDGNDAVLNWTDRTAYLYGGDGDDSLWLGGRVGATGYAYGGNGNDFIASGPGNDTMDGGPGVDMVSYTGSAEPVSASLTTNTGGRSYDADVFAAVENLAGGGAADVLSGNGSANFLDGGFSTICRVGGGGCQDVSGNDQIYGGGGNDTIYGRSGDDVGYGGAGNDSLSGEDGNDWLYGDAGDDTLDGGPGSNNLVGGPGFDLCFGGTKSQCEN